MSSLTNTKAMIRLWKSTPWRQLPRSWKKNSANQPLASQWNIGHEVIWVWIKIRTPCCSMKPQVVVCVCRINHLIIGVHNFDLYPFQLTFGSWEPKSKGGCTCETYALATIWTSTNIHTVPNNYFMIKTPGQTNTHTHMHIHTHTRFCASS